MAGGANAMAPRLTSFSDEAHDVAFHFQILHLDEQIFVWIGCNTAKFGQFFAAMPTRFDRIPSISPLLKGQANSPAEGIARRLALRAGCGVFLASNLPANSPVIEGYAERRVLQELQSLGYVKSLPKQQEQPAVEQVLFQLK